MHECEYCCKSMQSRRHTQSGISEPPICAALSRAGASFRRERRGSAHRDFGRDERGRTYSRAVERADIQSEARPAETLQIGPQRTSWNGFHTRDMGLNGRRRPRIGTSSSGAPLCQDASGNSVLGWLSAGPVCGLSGEPMSGVRSVTLDCTVVPECPPGPAASRRCWSASMRW